MKIRILFYLTTITTIFTLIIFFVLFANKHIFHLYGGTLDKLDTFRFRIDHGQKSLLNDGGKTFIGLFSKLEFQTINRNYTFNGKKKQLLLYISESWFSTAKMNKHFSHCRFSNCELSRDKRILNTADGIIFHFPYGKFPLKNPPIEATERRASQPWIAMYCESPSNIDASLAFSDKWAYTFNWSMSYHFMADIQIPYGTIKFQNDPTYKDYSRVFESKSKTAVWFVGNCHPESKREVLVKILQKDGIDIDIFGKCGKKIINDESVLNDYKFYLAFENSLCEDYITEKFFDRFNYDIILVTYGGADYNKLLPIGTFINAADFENATYLANYLKDLASDEKQYTQLLKEKDKYTTFGSEPLGWRYGLCELCYRMNNIQSNERVYQNSSEFLNKSQCKVPQKVKGGYVIV